MSRLLVAVSVFLLASGVAAKARADCDIDLNCQCGQTCDTSVVGAAPMCVPAAQDPGGHCVNSNSCIYIVNDTPQTCDMGSCTPTWVAGATCILGSASTSSTGGTTGASSSTSGGNTSGGVSSGGVTSGSAAGGSGSSTGAGASTASGSTGGGTATGGSTGSSTEDGGADGGEVLCLDDSFCDCGQVCRWNNKPHICVPAGTDPGTCSADKGCLYQGQSCNLVDMGVGPAPMEYHCYPAWTSESVCLLPDSGIYRPQNCAAGSEEPVWLVIALGLLGAALLSRRRSRI